MSAPSVITFDLFSALIDSRSGGSAALAGIASSRGWRGPAEELYDRWDALNKQAQKNCCGWTSYEELAQGALGAAYAELGIRGDAAADTGRLLASMAEWPLWPDVEEGLADLGHRFRIGVLSNVDDDLFRSTRAAPLVAPELALTSERLQAYKPDPRIYQRAAQALGSMVHIATSARDVAGALSAGIPVVRLRRPGHHLEPGGQQPAHTVDRVADLDAVLTALPGSP